MTVEKLNVAIHIEGATFEVGELVSDGRQIHFKYYPAFLDRGLNISPIRLPFQTGVHTGPPIPFNGLPGVFSDSLPEGWGKLLMDRALRNRDLDPFSVGPMDRLSFIGENGVGALAYTPAMKRSTDEFDTIDLDRIAKQVSEVIKGDSSEVVDMLFQMGGSSGGVRPKVHVGYDRVLDHMSAGSDSVQGDAEPWIIKFAASNDFADIANIEFAYHLMAQTAGVEMSECRLFKGRSGQEYFGTKRFDRTESGKLHMHSAAGIMYDDFRHSRMDYGHLMDCAFKLERDVRVYAKVLRLAAFNVFSHNRDDHSRNFSFLMDITGTWRFAPAYDLTFSSTGHGMHSTTIAGKGRGPVREDLMKLARSFAVKGADDIIDQVIMAVERWPEFAEKAGVSKNSLGEIGEALVRTLPS
jgi:serine/threonine-protein kinase HipA